MLEHKHIIVRAKVKNPPKNVIATEQWFRDLIDKIDMKLLRGPIGTYLDKEGNRGLTMIAIIETSHIAMHVWDEEDPALLQLDVYTCGTLDSFKVLEHLQEFEPQHVQYIYLDRQDEILIKEIK